MEKAALLAAGGLTSRAAGLYIEGPGVQRAQNAAVAASPAESTPEDTVIAYISQGGFVEAWPTLKLEPLLLTYAAVTSPTSALA